MQTGELNHRFLLQIGFLRGGIHQRQLVVVVALHRIHVVDGTVVDEGVVFDVEGIVFVIVFAAGDKEHHRGREGEKDCFCFHNKLFLVVILQ